jgi:Cation efflux family
MLTGSVGLLGDAIHNLSDVSASAVVFLGFRLSRRPPTEKYPYGLERAEDLAGVGIAVVIWASAAFARYESIRKLIEHGHTAFVGAGIAGAVLGIVGNLAVARTCRNRVDLPRRLRGHRRRHAPPRRRRSPGCHQYGRDRRGGATRGYPRTRSRLLDGPDAPRRNRRLNAGIVAEAAGLFAITNVDDIVVLSLFFGRAPGRRARPGGS